MGNATPRLILLSALALAASGCHITASPREAMDFVSGRDRKAERESAQAVAMDAELARLRERHEHLQEITISDGESNDEWQLAEEINFWGEYMGKLRAHVRFIEKSSASFKDYGAAKDYLKDCEKYYTNERDSYRKRFGHWPEEVSN